MVWISTRIRINRGFYEKDQDEKDAKMYRRWNLVTFKSTLNVEQCMKLNLLFIISKETKNLHAFITSLKEYILFH